MKVFIDYDHDQGCYVAESEDKQIRARHDNQSFIKLAFIGVARTHGHSGHAADYDFVMRSGASGEGGAVDLDEFWNRATRNNIERIKNLADTGVSFEDIAERFGTSVDEIRRVVRS